MIFNTYEYVPLLSLVVGCLSIYVWVGMYDVKRRKQNDRNNTYTLPYHYSSATHTHTRIPNND